MKQAYGALGERLVWSGLTMMAGKPVVEQGADEENGTDGKETVQCDEAIELRNGECRHGVTFLNEYNAPAWSAQQPRRPSAKIHG